MQKISYLELSKRVSDCIMNNNIMNTAEPDYWELYSGQLYKIDEDGKEYEDPYEIYQTYIITKSDADYLARNTDERVYYNDKLEMYIWAITHFGTPWNGVYTTIKD